jgi:hypothetical protein
MKYLKEFQTHVQYEAYTADTANKTADGWSDVASRIQAIQ